MAKIKGVLRSLMVDGFVGLAEETWMAERDYHPKPDQKENNFVIGLLAKETENSHGLLTNY